MSLVAMKNDRSDLIVSTSEWSVLKEQCSMLVKSGFLPKAVDTTEKAVAIALKGRELGIAPMHAFAHINVIQGKPCISAELMLALILRNIPGSKVEIERYEADGCTLLATRPGNKPARFTFDHGDAKAAELLGKDNWRKYPRAMFRSRAISEMARSVFPDAIMGCSYTPEEMGATVNEDGEVIDVTPSPKVETVKVEAPPPPEMEIPFAPPPAAPVPKRGAGYDGSAGHQKILHSALKDKEVPEDYWEEINNKMIGRSFPDLDAVIQGVRQGAV